MESKDWIILLVPIFAEGLFFFLIQNYINTKFKQIEMRKNHQKEVLHQFHVLLQDFYTAYLGIQAIDERRSGRNVSFHEVWNPAQAKIDKLIIFHAANPCAIKKLDKDFAECISKWQYISSVLYESRINNNGKISAKCAVIFSQEYSKLDVLIKECLEECERQIMDA